MQAFRLGLMAVVLLCARFAHGAEQRALDLKRAVPEGAYLAVYGKHNPERDFQNQYYKEVWKTVQETKIIERAVEIVASRLSQDEVARAKAVLEELKEAAAPIPLEAMADAKEGVYAQMMETPAGEFKMPPIAQHLILVRLAPGAGAKTQEGITNLFRLLERYAKGKVSVASSEEAGARIVTLSFPKQVPYRPTTVCIQDVLLVSSSDTLARQSLGMLVGGEGRSKFDDPRLKEALSRLPEPEDGLVFYDFQQQFRQLRGFGDFIRQVSRVDRAGQSGQHDAKAERIAGLLDLVFDEVSVLDYEVTVEYTEGNLNRSAVYGKMLPGTESKLLAKVLAGGEAFKDWEKWVPADATSFSLTTGAKLHPLYERVVAVIHERFPEARPALEHFEQIQTRFDVHLDKDILQAFSGECVSVSLPSGTAYPVDGQESVWAMRCHKPDRIRELLHRLVDGLKEHPAVAAQQLRLVKCEELEGFEELSALVLTGLGVKPVIGFRDGWMVIGSNARAVTRVLDTRAEKKPSIAGTKTFEQFRLSVKGPVQAISYTNTAADTRRFAALLNQVGTMFPIVDAMVAAKANPEAIKPVREAVALLPSVGKIVAKFDFLEAKMSVTQAGDQPGAYQRRAVIVVRPATGR